MEKNSITSSRCLPLYWWQRKHKVTLVPLTSSAVSGQSTMFTPPQYFHWHELFWNSCKSFWAKTWPRAHNHCRAHMLPEMGGVEDGKRFVFQELWSRVTTISFMLMAPVCLLHSCGIRKTFIAHFSVICHFYCAKARLYKCSLSLHIKSRVCKSKRMWGWWKKNA